MQRIILVILFISGILFSSCDPDRVFDANVVIPENKWSVNNRPVFYVDINDTSSFHDIYLNVRNTGNFRYSNLFILLTVQGPQAQPETKRYEFKLAEPDGKWLGSGLGDIYSNQILMIEKIRFQKSGVYSFRIEQNMRENPLEGIEDVGIRIAKSNN